MLPFIGSAMLAATGTPAETRTPREGELLMLVYASERDAERTGRSVLPQILARQIAPPAGPGPVKLPNGVEAQWTVAPLREDGSIDGENAPASLFCWVLPMAESAACLADVRGAAPFVLREGVHAGDYYMNGEFRTPIHLEAGTNHLWFLRSRDSIRVSLEAKDTALAFASTRWTVPVLSHGAPQRRFPIGVPIANMTGALRRFTVSIDDGANPPVESGTLALPPMTLRAMPLFWEGTPPSDASAFTLNLRIREFPSNAIVDETTTSIRVRPAGELYARTFVSAVDGSVQEYAVSPAQGGPSEKKALVLALHGAGVSGWGHTAAYGQRDWGTIVGATNRDEFGFDWEDWGRLDALEVLADAGRHLAHDPSRVYLTGHSMGGHGTWHIGTLYPDRFAAIGPSAGWVSFDDYGRGRRNSFGGPAQEFFDRANEVSDTASRFSNLRANGVYILHGDADDNVPVSQARRMKRELEELRIPHGYHEQPGAGHWWGGVESGGAKCVDWQPMWNHFATRRIADPAMTTAIDFSTPDPAVSARLHWIVVEQQQRPLEPTRIVASGTENNRAIDIVTTNTATFSLDLSALPKRGPIRVTVDGDDGSFVHDGNGPERIVFRFEKERWTSSTLAVPGWHKNPARGGGFKNAFSRNAALVYPTGGTPEENALAFSRARFDADQFRYRGNGAFELVSDREVLQLRKAQINIEPHRNYILYGNADTNAAWAELLGQTPPIDVLRDRIALGDGTAAEGDDAFAVYILPQRKSLTASVGVVGWTGLEGLRQSFQLSYLTSGFGLPDYFVAEPGPRGPNVRAVGFFDNEWKLGTDRWPR